MRRKTRYIRRYTHVRTRRAGRWAAALAAAGFVAYLALAMGTGAWVHNSLFGEENSSPSDGTENEHSDAEAVRDIPAKEITETVAFPAMELYALSIPAADEEAAEKTAALCRARGGAGYVRGSEVLLAVYDHRAVCREVADKLTQSQGIGAEVTPFTADAVEMRLTALPQRIDGIRDAFSVWQQTVQHMDGLWQDLDSGISSAEQALGRMQEKRDALSDVCDAAFEDALLSGRSDALEGFYRVIGATLEQMDALLSDPPENILEVSAKIKYTVIGVLTEYQYYVDSLKANAA